MKILRSLTGSLTEENFVESRGTITAIHNEPVKGFFRQARLTGNCLVMAHQQHTVAIPLAELFALAESVVPELKPPVLVVSETAAATPARQPEID